MIRQIATFTTSSPEYIDLSSEIITQDSISFGWKIAVPKNRQLQLILDTGRGIGRLDYAVVAVKLAGAQGASAILNMDSSNVMIAVLSKGGGAIRHARGALWGGPMLAGAKFVYVAHATSGRPTGFDTTSSLTMVVH